MIAKLRLSGITFLALLAVSQAAAQEKVDLKFDFGQGKVADGYTQVVAATVYSDESGYGFEPGGAIEDVDRAGDALTGDFITSDRGFRFSVKVPEGNYRVRITLGDSEGESKTMIRSENRRLMFEGITTAKGQFRRVEFIANMRTNKLSPGNRLKFDSREWNYETNRALTPTWDDKLSIQFGNERSCVCAIEIEAVEDVVTIFVMGDSTVTDQSGETSGTWGQNLPRWFTTPVVVANHAESGQTAKGFRFQRRWDKVMEEIKPGDYVLMQFGHNDSKSNGHDPMWPDDDRAGDWAMTHSAADTDYKWLLAANAVEIQRRGATPVIISPMTRIDRQSGRINRTGHGAYPKAAAEAAGLAGCLFIDLNAMSVEILEALGTEITPMLYTDGAHTSGYGGYLFSRCIVEGLRKADLDIVKYLVEDAGTFDTKNPSPLPGDYKVPADNMRSSFRTRESQPAWQEK